MNGLEPEANGPYTLGPSQVAYSQALSLKRIADALEKLLALPRELVQQGPRLSEPSGPELRKSNAVPPKR